MRPIRKGDRGPAVEDVQRRLRSLGADIGPTGIDGVFLGATLAAVREFQRSHGLDEDGDVGPLTWAALVDATFTLGDRLIFLKVPHFHGADVRALQGALNALGFAAGGHDGIFGAYTERAVREFQSNAGIPADGIVGPDTVRALGNLRHAWSDKAPEAPYALRRAPARSADALSRVSVLLLAGDEVGMSIAERVANLALASNGDARVEARLDPACPAGEVLLAIEPSGAATGDARSVAADDGGEPLAERLRDALAVLRAGTIVISLRSGGEDERSRQRIAVGVLDGLCAALTAHEPPVMP